MVRSPALDALAANRHVEATARLAAADRVATRMRKGRRSMGRVSAGALSATIGTCRRLLDHFDACAMKRNSCVAARVGRGTMPAMTNPAPSTRRMPHPAALLAVAVVVAVGVAWWMTGAPPETVDSGLPSDPPPMALPAELDADSTVAVAAGRLAAGRLEDARERFIDEVAERPDDVVAQTGLILSRWRSTGPRSVERDLAQLAREYPEDAFVALHLGLVQTMLKDGDTAQVTLAGARDMARRDDTPTGLRFARLADDVMHSGSFRGYLPVLVRAIEVAPAHRATVTRLLAAVERDDRVEVARLARELDDSRDPMARVAGAAGGFTKDDPLATASRLEALADERGATEQSTARATLLAGLARAWSGRDRDGACELIEASTSAGADVATKRLAAPIAAELCD